MISVEGGRPSGTSVSARVNSASGAPIRQMTRPSARLLSQRRWQAEFERPCDIGQTPIPPPLEPQQQQPCAGAAAEGADLNGHTLDAPAAAAWQTTSVSSSPATWRRVALLTVLARSDAIQKPCQ